MYKDKAVSNSKKYKEEMEKWKSDMMKAGNKKLVHKKINSKTQKRGRKRKTTKKETRRKPKDMEKTKATWTVPLISRKQKKKNKR